MIANTSPTNFVIFGFTGNLTKIKILPSLYHLELDKKLGDDFEVIGTARREVDLVKYKQSLAERLKKTYLDEFDQAVLDKLFSRINIVKLDLQKPENYFALKDDLHKKNVACSVGHNRIFYFAIPPNLIAEVVQNLVDADVHHCGESAQSRLLIEKPFGTSKKSAEEILSVINKHFSEENIYRIDHYLAKETAQNIMYFRFNNPLLRSVWDSKHIKQIQIAAREDIDVKDRGAFYEQTGAFRDMVQSHLLQLTALVTMDEPDFSSAEDVRSRRAEVMQSLSVASAKDVVRAQYQDYKGHVDNPESNTETFVALKTKIKTDRWGETPVYMLAGKALSIKSTEIKIVFSDDQINDCPDNILTLQIQPFEGISLDMSIKDSGFGKDSKPAHMSYCFHKDNKIEHNAYEKLIIDTLLGDQTLFPSTAEIMSQWNFVDGILANWAESRDQISIYEQGAEMPEVAQRFIEEHNNEWLFGPEMACRL